MRKTLFVLFGAPGSGKGYLGDCIKQELIARQIVTANEIGYISTGDLLRAEIASGSHLGQQISEIISSGKLVSDQIVDKLVEKALQDEKVIIFIDGYPRTQAQLDAFKTHMLTDEMYLVVIKRDTPVSLILERVSKRRVCKSCKCTHSVEDGCCPKCGGESIIRKDDAVIESRLEEYEKNTAVLWPELFEISDDAFPVDGCNDAEESAKEIVDAL